MFESGMKENEQNRVEITDVNENIMEEMLKFIYTGKCENLDELAEDLLIAADRFDMNDLKRICVESIYKKSLSVDNALKILILADRYDANKLKSMVIDFIVDKQSEMIQLPTWDSIMPMHPLLLNEVCKVALSRTSKTSKE
ncbi:speckle-type POZ protein B-like [Planococcus citri]|uniref:speckle-type POZ protein B-like n=1 Tax=Planococcus citri TaxID=170843 RepID=UPI0031FA28E3